MCLATVIAVLINNIKKQEEMLKLTIDIDFPSLNYVINETKKGGRGKSYSKIKKTQTTNVWLLCNNQYKAQGSPVFRDNVMFLFVWHSKKHKNGQVNDPDNLEFSVKFILDGLNKLGVFPDDSYKYTSGQKIHSHKLSEKPFVELYVRERSEELENQIIELFLNQ